MFFSFLCGLTLSKSISLLLEGSGLAITTFYTARSTRRTQAIKRNRKR